MSDGAGAGTNTTKPGALRQAVTLLVALGIAAVAAIIIVPKLQSSTSGPVRIDISNGTQGSMLELQLDLRVPGGENASLPSAIPAGGVITVYEGMGPVEVETLGYVSGADGNPVTRQIDATVEPGGVMVLRVRAEGVSVDNTPASTP